MWSFHMEFMKHTSGEIFKIHMKQPRAKDSVYHMTLLKLGRIAFKMNIFFAIRKRIVDTCYVYVQKCRCTCCHMIL